MLAGLLVPHVQPWFARRTHALILMSSIGAACLALMGWTSHFWVAIVLLILWGLSYSLRMPIRQAYLNGVIPSEQRATVLSFDNLLGSAGGVVAQPALGRIADFRGYPAAYMVSAAIQIISVPFLALTRRENAASDRIDG